MRWPLCAVSMALELMGKAPARSKSALQKIALRNQVAKNELHLYKEVLSLAF